MYLFKKAINSAPHPPKTLIVESKEKVARADSAVASHTSAGFELADLMFEGFRSLVMMVEKVVVVKMLIDRENVADLTAIHVCANKLAVSRRKCLRERGCCFVLGLRGHCFCFVGYFAYKTRQFKKN